MLTPGVRKRLPRLAPIILILALSVAGILASVYAYTRIDDAGREHILDRAATIAVAVPEEALDLVSGTDADQGTVPYQTLKGYLERMRAANPDARFLYLIGKNTQGELFFYADSEPALSPDYSPPGQIYDEATPGMYSVFEGGKPLTEGPDRDRWGVWISGYAPIYDDTGTVRAIVGMDLPAARYILDTLAYALLPLLLALILIFVVIATERARSRELAYVEQKAEFLSIASHEIRTPLTGIRWAIEGLLFKSSPPLDPRASHVLSLVHQSCLDLITRVNNLLDLTALEGVKTPTLRLESIAIAPFLTDIADSLLLSAKQRNVIIDLAPSLSSAGSLTGDREMLHHAFYNLITNAVKYTREGTTVRVGYTRERGMHIFHISDKGPGIPKGEEKRIFSGYHRTPEAIKSGQYGTGLGLYLVRKAAELHGGYVRAETSSEGGAVFTLSLPDVTPSASLQPA